MALCRAHYVIQYYVTHHEISSLDSFDDTLFYYNSD